MTEYYDEDGNWVSKTQRKKDCDAMQEIGERMIKLNTDELDQIDMDSELRNAIDEARHLKSHGALKRQKQYIGKIIRSLDAEHLQQQLDRILHKHDIHSAEFKRLEKWRDNIIENGDEGINAFIKEYPDTDRHHLRQLLRNAIKEKKNDKPPAAARQIFKYLREVVDQSGDANGNTGE